jgi:arylesterase/paraoxonase
MGRRVAIAALFLVAAVGVWVLWLFNAAGEFKTLTPHFTGRCTAVTGVVGAEDITIHPRTGMAYLSAFDRRAAFAGRPATGAIYAYDLNASSPQPVNLTPDAAPGFHPHGISLHVADDGTSTLFAINHAGGRHAIEIYDVTTDRLVHTRTLTDPLLVSPNDLLALTPTQVYITNDHGYPPGFLRTLEEYLRLAAANVVLWDGTRFREAAGGIRMANGINRSPDGTTVYVNAVIGQTVRQYAREPRSGTLTFRGEIALGSGGDNIEVAADGTLWIAAHPQLLTVVRYMSGALPRAPTQILRVVPRTDGSAAIDEVYLDLGEQISAASVAAVRGNRLLIGPIADTKVLDCRLADGV